MGEYIPKEIQIIRFSYLFPFGITFELLRIPISFLSIPQYWWLFAIQTDTKQEYLILVILGLKFEWKKL